MAGYGTQSDWYRNIQARPAIEVQVGRQHYTPQQRMLPAEETLAVLEEYQQHHPWAFRKLINLMGYAYDGSPEGLRALSQSLPAVALRP